jgi:hypothetical protein
MPVPDLRQSTASAAIKVLTLSNSEASFTESFAAIKDGRALVDRVKLSLSKQKMSDITPVVMIPCRNRTKVLL